MWQVIGSIHLLLLSSFMPPPPPASIAPCRPEPISETEVFSYLLLPCVLLRQHESYSSVSVGNLNSQVQLVTGLRTGQQRYRGSVPIKFLFSILHRCPFRLLFNAYRGSFPVGKMSGSWTEYTPLFSAEVKNDGSYSSTTPYTFMACTVLAILLPLPEFVVNLVLCEEKCVSVECNWERSMWMMQEIK